MLYAAWRSLLGRKVRLVMSTFAIVVGVAFVVGTLVFTDTLNRSFVAIFDNAVGDVVVQPATLRAGGGNVDVASSITVPAAVVADLGRVPGAARADGKIEVPGVFVVGRDGKVIGGQGPPGFAFNDDDGPAAHGVRPLTVVRGRDPVGTDEVALDVKTAERAGYRIGDQVQIVSATRRAVLRPRLVGLADFPDGGSLNGATATIWQTRAAQQLFLDGKDVFNAVWVTAEPGVSQRDLRAQVEQVAPSSLGVQTGDAAADQAASALLRAIRFLTVFLLVFAGIALVVGSFLIVNTFSILVAQRSRELALLRALGASRRQVSSSVLFEALVVGLVGSTVGVGLGLLLAVGIKAAVAGFGLDLSGTGLVHRPRTFVAAYVVGVLVTMVAAWLPARRTTRIAPVEALRDDVAMPESSTRARFRAGLAAYVVAAAVMLTGLLADVPEPGYWVGAGILLGLLGTAAASPVLATPFLVVAERLYRAGFGSVGRLAGQNSLRNPRRTAATASALMIGLALVTTMTIAGASAKASVDETVAKSFVGDLVVGNLVGNGFSPSVADGVERIDGVAAVARVRYGRARADGARELLVGVQPRTLSAVLRVEATGLDRLGADGCILNRRYAQSHGLGRGDLIGWQTPAGQRTYRVVGTYEANGAVFGTCLVGLETFDGAGFADQDNAVYVKVVPGTSVSGVQRAINARITALPTVSVKNQGEYAAEQRGPIDRLLTLVYALLGLALVIAVLGVVNTLGLSVIERTREIGLLRAIGLGRGQLRTMIALESVAISVLGAVLGVGLGVVFGVALVRVLRDQGLNATSVPVGALLGYLAAAAVIGVVAAAVPARRAARLDVLAAIAAE